MNWNDTTEQAEFRGQVRTFIQERLPEQYRRMDDTSQGHLVPWFRHRRSDDERLRQAATEWATALAERGWVAPHWPKEYGGAGLTTMEQYVFSQEMTRADAPTVGGNGMMMLGPTIIIHGTDEQKARILPGILSGEKAWCQGYSEPGAGSDLGGLSTRAHRDGDEYVINEGISLVVIEDIHTPGIDVRPLEDMGWQIDLTETFYEDVRVPAENLIGGENRGWYVAMTLLDFERSGVSSAASNEDHARLLVDFVRSDEGKRVSRVEEFGTIRAETVDRVIEAAVGNNFTLRIATMQATGVVPNYEASMGKMFNAQLNQAIQRTGVKAFGLYATLWSGDPKAPLNGRYTRDYVRTIPSTIAGGSNEIQRNIIATRGLGLPRG